MPIQLVAGADADGTGPDGGPPFPGQDYITPLLSLIGYAAVISIEPEPDNSPDPFTLKPLIDTDVVDVGAGVPKSSVVKSGAVFEEPKSTRSPVV
jgi:hypothetical protein